MHFTVFGISGNRRIALAVDHVFDQCFRLAFPYPAYFHGLGINHPQIAAGKIRHNLFFKHGYHFIGRAGQQNHLFPFPFHDNARSCTVFIIQHNSPFRHHRLLPVIFCQLQIPAGEIFLNPLFGRLMHRKFPAHYLRRNFLCQIIFRRA